MPALYLQLTIATTGSSAIGRDGLSSWQYSFAGHILIGTGNWIIFIIIVHRYSISQAI